MDKIQAGDTVKHGPTGETWYLLGVNKKRTTVCVAGWPPTLANLSDCVLLKKGKGLTKEELQAREKMFGAFGADWD